MTSEPSPDPSSTRTPWRRTPKQASEHVTPKSTTITTSQPAQVPASRGSMISGSDINTGKAELKSLTRPRSCHTPFRGLSGAQALPNPLNRYTIENGKCKKLCTLHLAEMESGTAKHHFCRGQCQVPSFFSCPILNCFEFRNNNRDFRAQLRLYTFIFGRKV